jgi:hypothetical protein
MLNNRLYKANAEAETLILGAEAAAGSTLKFFVPQFFCKISAFHIFFMTDGNSD